LKTIAGHHRGDHAATRKTDEPSPKIDPDYQREERTLS
jgi:hypothetical protein